MVLVDERWSIRGERIFGELILEFCFWRGKLEVFIESYVKDLIMSDVKMGILVSVFF